MQILSGVSSDFQTLIKHSFPLYFLNELLMSLRICQHVLIKVFFVSFRDETPFCSAVRGCRLSEIVTILLDLAARYLVLHGRLVYWLPIYRPGSVWNRSID